MVFNKYAKQSIGLLVFQFNWSKLDDVDAYSLHNRSAS